MKKYLILRAMNMTTIHYDIPCAYFEYTSMKYNERLAYHLFHSKRDEPSKTIHKAIKALSTNIFKWEIMDETNDEQEAKEMVNYYIAEYQSDVIGYNDMKDESMNLNPNDHRTWEELHGKERAEQMKQEQSERFKGMPLLSEQMKTRLSVWNPMNDPDTRAKTGKSGEQNNGAIYEYTFIKDDMTLTTPCLVEFIRNHPELNFEVSGIRRALQENRTYKGYEVIRTHKENKVLFDNTKPMTLEERKARNQRIVEAKRRRRRLQKEREQVE